MPAHPRPCNASSAAAPGAGALLRIASSLSLPAADRYEQWLQSQLVGVRVLPPTAQQRRDFRGSIVSLVSGENEIHAAEIDDFGAERSDRQVRLDGDESLALIYLLRGGVRIRYADGAGAAATSGQFFLYDPRRACHLHMSGVRLVQLSLPSAALRLLPAGLSADEAACALNRHPLARLLELHLREFQPLVATLDESGRAGLLDTTSSLAMTVLRVACQPPASSGRSARLYSAAQSHIQRHLDDPDLSAQGLARALGCGRSTLYEAFAVHGQGVAESIREARLQAVACLLRHAGPEISIADLAHQCGLQDASNFSRLFRRRFQVAPQAFRSQHRRWSV